MAKGLHIPPRKRKRDATDQADDTGTRRGDADTEGREGGEGSTRTE